MTPSNRIKGLVVEGLAIVSADGMIADATGVQPEALKVEADQRFFHDSLQKAGAVVHGRHSGEDGPAAEGRRRLILTRRVSAIAPDPTNPRAVLWNPAGASFEDAWAALELSGGPLAVIGGTDVFGLFLELGYDAFHLTHTPNVRLPGGRPVFPGVPLHGPDDLLRNRGLKPEPARILDPAIGLELVTWRP